MRKEVNILVPLVVYPFTVMVSLNQTGDAFDKHVLKHFSPNILEDFKSYTRPNGLGLSYLYTSDMELCCIIRIYSFTQDAESKGVLAHEIFHACEFVLRKCGLELNSNSNEAYAYLIGYLTQEIYKKL